MSSLEEFILNFEKHINRKSKILEVQVRFGMASKDCRNFGICSVEKNENSLPEFVDEQFHAFALLSLFKENILFSFFKDSMIQEVEKKYFSEERFIVGEKYTLGKEISDFFEGSKLIIKKGTYPITESEGFFRIIC